MTFRTLLREPLVHFLGIGLALFLLYALVAPADRGGDRIVISAAAVESLKAQHAKLWGRPPGSEELSALVETRIRDEILYLEGLAMGLDKDDAVIKRRVRQKYDLIAEEETAATAATDAELEAFLAANPDRFRAPAVVSFQQIVVPQAGTEADMDERIAATKAALAGGASPDRLGATTLLPAVVPATPLDLVAREFGSRFAEALAAAPVGQWAGPLSSAYGIHLVRLDSRTPSAVPPLSRIRPQVAREWENARRTQARDARMAELRQSYDVVIEGLDPKPAS